MKQAEQHLKSPDRSTRKEVFELIESRRKQDADELNNVMSDLIRIRTLIANNCGFESYTDYKYSYRYDYDKATINQFHESIREVVTPIVKKMYKRRNQIWKLDEIKPYDFDAPLVTDLNSELFTSTDEMIDQLCVLLQDINPDFVTFIRHLQSINNLDLETRKNKAP